MSISCPNFNILEKKLNERVPLAICSYPNQGILIYWSIVDNIRVALFCPCTLNITFHHVIHMGIEIWPFFARMHDLWSLDVSPQKTSYCWRCARKRWISLRCPIFDKKSKNVHSEHLRPIFVANWPKFRENLEIHVVHLGLYACNTLGELSTCARNSACRRLLRRNEGLQELVDIRPKRIQHCWWGYRGYYRNASVADKIEQAIELHNGVILALIIKSIDS